MNLEPITPEALRDIYREHRRDELADESMRSHMARLKKFVEFCDEESIRNMNDVDGRTLHAYRVHRRENADLKPVTLQGQLSTLRQFLRVGAAVDAVPENLPEKIMLPSVGKGQRSSDSHLDAARAKSMLAYLEKYEYASRYHLVMLLLWRTSARRGGVRALDLGDFDREEGVLEFRHRPETDTPLKNKEWGERDVSLKPGVAAVVEDYVDGPRPNVVDEEGRAPLLTTDNGRPALSTIQAWAYAYTRPCEVGEPCPHDREPESCEATDWSQASTCPSSRSPHRIRAGSVTAFLDAGTPKSVLTDRVDMTESVMDEHYDKASKRGQMERRRDYVEDP